MYKLLTSDTGRISLHYNPNKDKHSEKIDLPYWQGTVVGVDISLDQTEPFIDLLKHIRKVYGAESKGKKKQFYKARFL